MAISLFARKKAHEVQSFVLNMVNNRCPSLSFGGEELRFDTRVNLTTVVLVSPLDHGEVRADRSLVTVTADFSSTGVSLVFGEYHDFDEVILGFPRRASSMTFVHAKAKHSSPMGASFYKQGFRLLEIVPVDRYPELKSLEERF